MIHVLQDMFYAAVEMRDNPALRDVPMAVGGIGMLSTSNYAARKFGVRAAMPGYIGKKLCPELVIVPTRFDAYREASKKVAEVLRRWDPDFYQVGMDESYVSWSMFCLQVSLVPVSDSNVCIMDSVECELVYFSDLFCLQVTFVPVFACSVCSTKSFFV